MRIDLDRAVLHRGVNLTTGPAGKALSNELTGEGSTARKSDQTNCLHGRRALGEGPATALK